jgi:hypothetical protein
LKAKCDPLAFATATFELHLLRRLADAHYLNRYYFDESRFTLVSNVPRAWQAPGEPVALTATRGPGVNVAGFLRYDGTDLHAYTSEQSINSADGGGPRQRFHPSVGRLSRPHRRLGSGRIDLVFSARLQPQTKPHRNHVALLQTPVASVRCLSEY